MISFMISKDKMPDSYTENKSTCGTFTALSGISSLVSRDSLIPASVLLAVSRRLSHIVMHSAATTATTTTTTALSSEIDLITSTLRLLSIVLDDSGWRLGLGLGGVFEGGPDLGKNRKKER
jgi:hypothetical protein